MKNPKNKVAVKWKTVIGRALVVLCAATLGVNLYLTNAQVLTGDQMPMPFGYGASVVLSGSMEPALSVGDLLIVRSAPAYQPGDVVVYQAERMAVVHRLLSTDGETAVTKGDANTAKDAPIAVTAIKGKVVSVIPLLGYPVWALKSPLGVISTLGAAILLVELSFRREKTDKDAEQERIKAEIRALMKELEQEN